METHLQLVVLAFPVILYSSLCDHNPKEVSVPLNSAYQSPAVFGSSSGLH